MHCFWSHLIFGNQNYVASSLIHRETHGGRRVVPSLMVAGNGAIRFACMPFFIPATSLRQARSMEVSNSGRKSQNWKKEGGAAFHGNGKRVSEGIVVGVVVGMVLGLADAHGWMSVGHYIICLVKGNSPPEVS